MVRKLLILKKKNSEIVSYPLCLGGLSKDISQSNTFRAGLVEYICDFSVDY